MFWDTSAILPLVLAEPTSATVRALAQAEPEVLVWWGTATECLSAIARVEREGGLTASEADAAMARVRDLEAFWVEVLPTARVRNQAGRLLRRHPLRAADALQLAAAWVWADGQPGSHAFVTFDLRLAAAARGEGFRVVCPRP